MGNKVKRTIFLPEGLAREVETRALAEGQSLSGIIEDALRSARVQRRFQALHHIQGYWSRVARERGILADRDLIRYLKA